jgi:hypothetical protein
VRIQDIVKFGALLVWGLFCDSGIEIESLWIVCHRLGWPVCSVELFHSIASNVASGGGPWAGE